MDLMDSRPFPAGSLLPATPFNGCDELRHAEDDAVLAGPHAEAHHANDADHVHLLRFCISQWIGTVLVNKQHPNHGAATLDQ